MGFHRQIRTRITCDTCEDAWLGALAQSVDPTFTTRAKARRYLVTELGWTITTRSTVCAECTARHQCEQLGHLWAEDTDLGWAEWVDGQQLPATRYCRRCDAHLPLSEALGTHHPEHVPGLLTTEEQAALVAIESRLRQV